MEDKLIRRSAIPTYGFCATVLRWTVVCWVIVFWRLGYVGLIDDGAHYATLTREMLLHKSWMVPLLDGSPYIDKPVLFHWLQGLAVHAIGENEVALRLPSAVAAVVLFLLTKWIGVRLFDVEIGKRAWLMLATVPATFVLARVGYLDMLFTAFLFGSMACFAVGALKKKLHLQYTAYALLVPAVMTKGPVALVLFGLFLVLGWLAGGEVRRSIVAGHWKSGLLLALVGSSPWFVWMGWQFGDEFVQGYFLRGHVAYLAPRSSASSFTHTFYLQMFITAFFPWSLVTAAYAVDTIRRRRAGTAPHTGDVLLWAWVGAVILLFTLARFRVDRYIFPAAPAVCLLAARAWMSSKRDPRGYPATRMSILAVAIILAALGVVLAASFPRLTLNVSSAALMLPAALALGGAVIAVMMLRHHLTPPLLLGVPIATMVVVYGLLVVFGLPLIEAARPAKEVGLWLRSQSALHEPVGVYGLERWETALRYYATRPVHRLGDDNDALEFLNAPGPGWAIMRRDHYDALNVADAAVNVTYAVPAVTGTTGTGIRRQIWTEVVIVRKDP